MGVSMDCLCEVEKGVSRGISGGGGLFVGRLVGWLLVLFGTEGERGRSSGCKQDSCMTRFRQLYIYIIACESSTLSKTSIRLEFR